MGLGDDKGDEDDIYCNGCGEERRIEYLRTSALHDHWKCRYCGTEFTTPKDDDEEE